jgi:NAD(P)-dependent dehydrogenase (short-subunit alcohol dehydrogenase family)
LALARERVKIVAIGRNPVTLAETVEQARKFSDVTGLELDLTKDSSIKRIAEHLESSSEQLDILIHCAGIISQGLMETSTLEDLDAQYLTNVRAPYDLTRRLQPLLKKSRGQIVFMNSSAGLSARRPDIGQYSATKHALKAIAESLREEVNPMGIRVLNVYLGRTATPMQKSLHEREGKTYDPDCLLQSEDVASIVIHALQLPSTAEVTDISIRPMIKSGN